MGIIADERACQRADTGLQEDVGGFACADGFHLLDSLMAQCGIALDDQLGDLFIAFPCGILDQMPAVFSGQLGGQLNGIIIVHLGDDAVLGADALDGINAALGRTLGHIDIGLAAVLVGSPCNAAAVVAVGGGDKDHVLGLFTDLGAVEHLVGCGFGIEAQLAADDLTDSEDAAHALEGIEAELLKALGLVLDINAADAQGLAQVLQADQRGGTIEGDRLVETLDKGDILGGQIGIGGQIDIGIGLAVNQGNAQGLFELFCLHHGDSPPVS